MRSVTSFCHANNIEDIDNFMYQCFKQGFDIKKYGFLGETGIVGEKLVEIEVIREKRVEVPVEIIKEVEKIVEVPVDRIVEIIKEVPVEKVVIQEVIKEVPVDRVVEKIIQISDDTQINELLSKIEQLNGEISIKSLEIDNIRREFSTKTKEMENIFQNKMSKKDEELDELRHNLDINLDIKVDDSKTKMLETTLQNLRKELKLKNDKIVELENKNKQIESQNMDKGAIYMNGSNLTKNL